MPAGLFLATYQKVQSEGEVQSGDDHVEDCFLMVSHCFLILIDLQGHDQADDKEDGEEKPERLLPEQPPCLPVPMKRTRVGRFVSWFWDTDRSVMLYATKLICTYLHRCSLLIS